MKKYQEITKLQPLQLGHVKYYTPYGVPD